MQKTLQKYFGYSDFRYLQKEIISDVLKGHDTFALMPTGGGKSLCYQLPALIKDGVTVVVSPLISLMKDQVDGLKANGISAEYINSTLTYKQINEIKDKLVKKELKILYLAPERLLMSDIISHLKKTSIALFAIDEAHCISEWGHDFRPEYRKLSILKKHFKDVPIIALTATASPRVQKDIVTQLKLRDCKIYKGSFNRVNLSYYVNEKRDTYKQIRRFLIRYRNQSGIIYCQSRNAVEKIAKMLQSDGFRALPYHAGLSDNVRELNQNLFIQDDVDIIVATVAFGMGIDKPNVRFIIHYDLPKNLESYYQETGRGGRDGLPCDCILFFSYADKHKIDYFINEKKTKEERNAASLQLDEMINYCESSICRRKKLLKYFGEKYEFDNCSKCDVCLDPKEAIDAAPYAKKIIDCIDETGQSYGINYIVDILKGSRSKKILTKNHHLLKSYGSGKNLAKNVWISIINQLISLKVLDQSKGKYPILILNTTSEDVYHNDYTLKLTLPTKATRFKSEKTIYDESIPGLFERLRDLRKYISDVNKVPPYIIFSDRSLIEMASKLPMNDDDFLNISGVGDHKLEKYGHIFMAEIKKVKKEHEKSWDPKKMNIEDDVAEKSL